MTQKDKELLLKDLCGRLPYGVICQIYDPQQDYGEDIFDARLIHIDAWTSHCYFWGCSETDPYKIEQVKPYLRPLSSMTEEEIVEINSMGFAYWTTMINNDLRTRGPMSLLDAIITHHKMVKLIDWLNAHHFDYRGLIEKGLAIEVTEDNNPYKEL